MTILNSGLKGSIDTLKIVLKGCTLFLIKFDLFNPFAAKLSILIFHQLEVVSRYRDPQLQVGENDSHLFNLRQHICKS